MLRIENQEALFQGEAQAALENEYLPAYLRARRWFGEKSAGRFSLEIQDRIRLIEGPHPADLLTVVATTEEGRSSTYVVPLRLGPEGLIPGQRAVIARVEWRGGEGLLFDATDDDDFCRRLLELVVTGSTLESARGRLIGVSTAPSPLPEGEPKVSRGSGEQSNTTLIFGGLAIMKLFRRIEPGVNPDFEIGRFLTERARFEGVPKTLGAITLERPTESPATLAILQEFLPNQGQGWEWLLGVLAGDLGALSKRGGGVDSIPGPTSEGFLDSDDSLPEGILGASPHAIEVLGTTTGAMHVALASALDDPAFAPEPLTRTDLEAIGGRLASQSALTFEALGTARRSLPEGLQEAAEVVLDRGSAAIERLAGQVSSALGSVKIRIHGDYHLGQVLRKGDGFRVVDFEGEPSKPLVARLAKQSPLRDVAGMLRSFDYAGSAALFSAKSGQAGELPGLEAWTNAWRAWVSRAFVRAYAKAVEPAGLLPANPEGASGLLTTFLLEKLLFEVSYELSYRPDWVRIPLLTLRGLMDDPRSPG